jgi:hypothetical protein
VIPKKFQKPTQTTIRKTISQPTMGLTFNWGFQESKNWVKETTLNRPFIHCVSFHENSKFLEFFQNLEPNFILIFENIHKTNLKWRPSCDFE